MVRDGYKFAVPPIVLGAAAAAFGWRATAATLLSAGALVAYFFRDPQRVPPGDPGVVVSPADGRVMEIVSEQLDGRPGQRVSIFLAIWDVHVNRSPMAGRVQRLDYRPGRFYAAMRSRASSENEQNVIRLETDHGQIMFKQIAGWVARRVVCWKKPGDSLALGERIGLIRFGSRMDVWLPENAEIVAKVGEHVAGGVSVLARWR
jgi:phosphatidylserine decarboxylase